MIAWNIRGARSASQRTDRSLIGTPHVRPFSPSTRVIAIAHRPARTGDMPLPNSTVRVAAMLRFQ